MGDIDDATARKVGFALVENDVTRQFAKLKSRLKKAGIPLPINDVWIAAHALESGSVIITFDAHFKAVPGLRSWEIAEWQHD